MNRQSCKNNRNSKVTFQQNQTRESFNNEKVITPMTKNSKSSMISSNPNTNQIEAKVETKGKKIIYIQDVEQGLNTLEKPENVFKSIREEKEAIDLVNDVNNYSGYSLFIFHKSNPFRRFIFKIVSNKLFDIIVTIHIILNSIILALNLSISDDKKLDKVWDKIENYFITIYTIEFLLKIISYGIMSGKKAYLKEFWNFLDFIVVVSSWITLLGQENENNHFSTIRNIRLFRPLRSLFLFPKLKLIITMLSYSLKKLFNIFMLMMLLFVFFGSFGINAFSGILSKRCREGYIPKHGEWEPYSYGEGEIRVCGIDNGFNKCLSERDPNDLTLHEKEEYEKAKENNNPIRCVSLIDTYDSGMFFFNPTKSLTEEFEIEKFYFGYNNFNNFLSSLIILYQSSTLSGWSIQLYIYQDGYNYSISTVFFVVVILVFRYFIINFCIGIMLNSSREDYTYHEIKFLSKYSKTFGETMVKKIINKAILKELLELIYTWIFKINFFTPVRRIFKHHYKFKLTYWFYLISKQPIFNFIMHCCTLINILSMVFEGRGRSRETLDRLELINKIMIYVFIFEFAIKVIGYGPKHYFNDKLNLIDAFVVVTSSLELFLVKSGYIGVLATIKIVRIVDILKMFKGMRVIVKCIGATIKEMFGYVILMFIIMFCFSLIGMTIFKDNLYFNEEKNFDPEGELYFLNFQNIYRAMVAVFVLMIGDNWTGYFYRINRAGNVSTFISWSYFFVLILILNVILLNLVISFLVFYFEKTRKTIDYEEKYEIWFNRHKLRRKNRSNSVSFDLNLNIRDFLNYEKGIKTNARIVNNKQRQLKVFVNNNNSKITVVKQKSLIEKQLDINQYIKNRSSLSNVKMSISHGSINAKSKFDDDNIELKGSLNLKGKIMEVDDYIVDLSQYNIYKEDHINEIKLLHKKLSIKKKLDKIRLSNTFLDFNQANGPETHEIAMIKLEEYKRKSLHKKRLKKNSSIQNGINRNENSQSESKFQKNSSISLNSSGGDSEIFSFKSKISNDKIFTSKSTSPVLKVNTKFLKINGDNNFKSPVNQIKAKTNNLNYNYGTKITEIDEEHADYCDININIDEKKKAISPITIISKQKNIKSKSQKKITKSKEIIENHFGKETARMVEQSPMTSNLKKKKIEIKKHISNRNLSVFKNEIKNSNTPIEKTKLKKQITYNSKRLEYNIKSKRLINTNEDYDNFPPSTKRHMLLSTKKQNTHTFGISYNENIEKKITVAKDTKSKAIFDETNKNDIIIITNYRKRQNLSKFYNENIKNKYWTRNCVSQEKETTNNINNNLASICAYRILKKISESKKKEVKKIVVNKNPLIEYFKKSSLCIFHVDSKFRRLVIYICNHKAFDISFIIMTMLSCIIIVVQTNYVDPKSQKGRTLRIIDSIFIWLFVVENFLKIIAYGFIFDNYKEIGDPSQMKISEKLEQMEYQDMSILLDTEENENHINSNSQINQHEKILPNDFNDIDFEKQNKIIDPDCSDRNLNIKNKKPISLNQSLELYPEKVAINKKRKQKLLEIKNKINFVPGLKKAFLKDFINVIDLVTVISSMLYFIRLSDPNIKDADLHSLKVLRGLGALRPIKLASKFHEMRLAVECLFLSIPAILKMFVIGFFFFLAFGIAGIHIFEGKFGHCSLPEYLTANDCTDIGGIWTRDPINFDDITESLNSLIQMSTAQIYVELMEKAEITMSTYTNLYFLLFMVVCAIFIINISVTIIVDNYIRLSEVEKGTVILTESQKTWLRTMTIFLKYKPLPVFNINKMGFIKKWAYIIISDPIFKFYSNILIIVNLISTLMTYYRSPYEHEILQSHIYYTCTTLFTIEIILKIIVEGKFYFLHKWNIFDLIIIILGDVHMIVDLSIWGTKSNILIKNSSFRIFYSFLNASISLRVFRIINLNKTLREYVAALILMLPSILNIGLLIFLNLFVFSIIGMALFGTVKHGEFINDNVNFESFLNSALYLIRCNTGEGWNMVMIELATKSPGCKETQTWEELRNEGPLGCGSNISYVFFAIFIIYNTFITMNMLVAVIVDGFLHNINNEIPISDELIENFFKVWGSYDEEISYKISVENFALLLLDLNIEIGLKEDEYPRFDIRRSYSNKIYISKFNNFVLDQHKLLIIYQNFDLKCTKDGNILITEAIKLIINRFIEDENIKHEENVYASNFIMNKKFNEEINKFWKKPEADDMLEEVLVYLAKVSLKKFYFLWKKKRIMRVNGI